MMPLFKESIAPWIICLVGSRRGVELIRRVAPIRSDHFFNRI